jgi:hypothetical protein
MKNNVFRRDQLRKKEIQYLIRHKLTLKFKEGDIVFLKSNPELPLKVIYIDLEKVYCKLDDPCDNEVISFPPECLLHYKDGGLFIYKDEWIISYN